MKDLMISYDDKNGERINKVYDRVFDFTDALDLKYPGAPSMDCQNVVADFFENPLSRKHFNTIEELYYHCKLIMK